MNVTQVRLPEGLEKQIDLLVESGIYASKSDAIRAGVRKLVLDNLVGIMKDDGQDSVKQIREIRRKLSKEKINLAELNRLVD